MQDGGSSWVCFRADAYMYVCRFISEKCCIEKAAVMDFSKCAEKQRRQVYEEHVC